MQNNSNCWLCAYLYYTEPLQDILINGVKPLVSKILSEKLANQYFFIRYGERGPHIRLRFKGNEITLLNEVKPRLDKWFTDYFNNKPSTRIDSEYVKNLPEDKKWFPNNSIQYIPYEPETERYGGPNAILFAEKLFEASSNTVLEILEKSTGWGYERALGVAIQIHLSFAFAIGLTFDQAIFFFQLVHDSWYSRAYYNFEPNVSKSDLAIKAEETRIAFENNFEKQKEFLVPYHKLMWDGLVEGCEFEEEWINKWIQDCKQYNLSIIKLQKESKFKSINSSNLKYPSTIEKELFERLCVYEPLIHMTNNRLGILNRDEAFLGFLIKKSLEEISKS